MIWLLKLVLAYLAKEVKKLKEKGIESKVIDIAIKCLMCFVDCFQRVVEYVSKLGFIQVAITSNNFCTSCFQAITLFVSNPGKFGFVGALGQVFTFVGKIFVSAACGIVGYLALEQDTELSEKLNTKLFPVFVFIFIGFLISSLFFMIYGISADAVLLCVFKDKNASGNAGRPPAEFVPAPMRSFYSKYLDCPKAPKKKRKPTKFVKKKNVSDEEQEDE